MLSSPKIELNPPRAAGDPLVSLMETIDDHANIGNRGGARRSQACSSVGDKVYLEPTALPA